MKYAARQFCLAIAVSLLLAAKASANESFPCSSRLLHALNQHPSTLDRNGSHLFESMPAHWSVTSTPAKTLYFDPAFAREVIGLNPVDHAPHIRAQIAHAFSIEVGSAPAGSPPLTLFFDKHHDPLETGLNRSGGSPRSAYFGRHYNLKGLPGSPFAIAGSGYFHHSSVLALPLAFWELIALNTISDDLATGAPKVLAAIQTRKKIAVPWKGPLASGAIEVRYDGDGNLDRPVHLFETQKALGAVALTQIAREMGRLEGEKFIERVLHGGYPFKKVSIGGHMIDGETVSFVKTRAPIYTFDPEKHDNYFFGHEVEGLLQVIERLAAHPRINADRVPYPALERTLLSARSEQMLLRFPGMMGFPSALQMRVRSDLQDRLQPLVSQFDRLSRLFFPNFDSLYVWNSKHASTSVFDFSRFMRLYPLLRLSREWSEELALSVLVDADPNFNVDLSNKVNPRLASELVRQHGVLDSKQYSEVLDEARAWIRSYDALVDAAISRGWIQKATDLTIGAYIVNQDRITLNPHNADGAIERMIRWHDQEDVSDDELQWSLSWILRSYRRSTDPRLHGGLLSDVQIYQEGVQAVRFDSNASFRHVLIFPIDAALPHALTTQAWEYRTSNQSSAVSIRVLGDEVWIESPPLRLLELLDPKPYQFRYLGKKVAWTPLF